MTLIAQSPKKVFLQTFGCQMNERDSEAVTGLLFDRGYTHAVEIEEADLILYNTCSVRDHAEQKVFGRMGHFRRLKDMNPDLVIGILGCMAQEHGRQFFKKNPEIDLVCGPGNLNQVPALVDEILAARHQGGSGQMNSTKKLAIDRLNEEYGLDGIQYRADKVKALVNIMTGCDHRCTYCIVPYTRGDEQSRHSESVLREMKDLASRGYKDVMLLGQNVNSYGKGLEEKIDFSTLLEKIQETAPEISRLRFTTSHPKDAHTRLFQVMRDLPMVCEHLHLPVQSGSNAVLRRMKREHTIDWYKDQIAEYRTFLPEGSLTTDLIVGFPGETEKDFQDTLDLLEAVQFDMAYVFAYSPRPGTPALKLGDDVSAEEKNRRLQEVLVTQRAIAFAKNQTYTGKTTEVLFEIRSKRDKDRFVGRTRDFKRVVAHSSEDICGSLRQAKILSVADETLLGELV